MSRDPVEESKDWAFEPLGTGDFSMPKSLQILHCGSACPRLLLPVGSTFTIPTVTTLCAHITIARWNEIISENPGGDVDALEAVRYYSQLVLELAGTGITREKLDRIRPIAEGLENRMRDIKELPARPTRPSLERSQSFGPSKRGKGISTNQSSPIYVRSQSPPPALPPQPVFNSQSSSPSEFDDDFYNSMAVAGGEESPLKNQSAENENLLVIGDGSFAEEFEHWSGQAHDSSEHLLGQKKNLISPKKNLVSHDTQGGTRLYLDEHEAAVANVHWKSQTATRSSISQEHCIRNERQFITLAPCKTPGCQARLGRERSYVRVSPDDPGSTEMFWHTDAVYLQHGQYSKREITRENAHNHSLLETSYASQKSAKLTQAETIEYSKMLKSNSVDQIIEKKKALSTSSGSKDRIPTKSLLKSLKHRLDSSQVDMEKKIEDLPTFRERVVMKHTVGTHDKIYDTAYIFAYPPALKMFASYALELNALNDGTLPPVAFIDGTGGLLRCGKGVWIVGVYLHTSNIFVRIFAVIHSGRNMDIYSIALEKLKRYGITKICLLMDMEAEETNSATYIWGSEAYIRYCFFHLAQAWRSNYLLKFKNRSLRNKEWETCLKPALWKIYFARSLIAFNSAVTALFKLCTTGELRGTKSFYDYFRANYIEKVGMRERSFCYMFGDSIGERFLYSVLRTSNLIESSMGSMKKKSMDGMTNMSIFTAAVNVNTFLLADAYCLEEGTTGEYVPSRFSAFDLDVEAEAVQPACGSHALFGALFPTGDFDSEALSFVLLKSQFDNNEFPVMLLEPCVGQSTCSVDTQHASLREMLQVYSRQRIAEETGVRVDSRSVLSNFHPRDLSSESNPCGPHGLVTEALRDIQLVIGRTDTNLFSALWTSCYGRSATAREAKKFAGNAVKWLTTSQLVGGVFSDTNPEYVQSLGVFKVHEVSEAWKNEYCLREIFSRIENTLVHEYRLVATDSLLEMTFDRSVDSEMTTYFHWDQKKGCGRSISHLNSDQAASEKAAASRKKKKKERETEGDVSERGSFGNLPDKQIVAKRAKSARKSASQAVPTAAAPVTAEQPQQTIAVNDDASAVEQTCKVIGYDYKGNETTPKWMFVESSGAGLPTVTDWVLYSGDIKLEAFVKQYTKHWDKLPMMKKPQE